MQSKTFKKIDAVVFQKFEIATNGTMPRPSVPEAAPGGALGGEMRQHRRFADFGVHWGQET